MWSLHRHKRSRFAVMAFALLAAGAAVIATNGSSQSRADASTIRPVTQRFGVFRQNALPVSPSSLSDKGQLWLGSIQANQKARLAAEASQMPSDSPPATVPNAAVEGSSVSSLVTIASGDGATVVAALGEEQICAFDETAEVGTCTTADLAEAGHAFSAAPAGCNAYHVIGVMPDGVSFLEVKASSSDAVKKIPVTSNVYEATLSAEETVLTSQNPSVEVVLPLGDYASMNPAC
jgi:hypothetical protein